MLSKGECVVFYSSGAFGSTDEMIIECAARLGLARTTVKRAPLGKPYLSGGGEISVSHAEGLFLVAFAFCPIGIDAERSDRKAKNAAAIAEKYFSARELAFVENGGDAEFNRRFLKIWTRKEALVKLTGEGLFALKRADTCENEKFFTQIETKTHFVCLCSDSPIEKLMLRGIDESENNFCGARINRL